MEPHLFLIMSSNYESLYCFHRISEPRTPSEVGDETIIRSLGEPVFKMDESIFSSKLVSFATVDSRIFIVGGFSYDDKNRFRASKKVFVYDTLSSKLSQGPSLNYGKASPHMLTLDSKLFALSALLYSDDRKSTSLKRKVLFEVLDTSKLKDGWSPLAIPTLHVSAETSLKYSIYAFVAMYLDGGTYLGGVIFLTVNEAGTYMFDISKQTWVFASKDNLPFSGRGSTIPHAPCMCCAISTKSRALSVFRFCYKSDGTNQGLQIHEIKIDDPYKLSPPLPPLIIPRPVLMVQGLGGRFYLVQTGTDRPRGALDGNRFVKVIAYEFSNLKLKKEGKRKRGMVRRKGVETQLKLTGLWRMSFFGGRVCNPLTHVKAAFAM